ncbi:MAG: RNase adapter RapZ [Lachnospiraceae bacterium]|jgi:UPF0042 nucleotide-binding protein
MDIVIVTGMSGAGKSTAMNFLEDFGYYCVDNMPVPLISTFISLAMTSSGKEYQRIALGIDIRSRKNLPRLAGVIDELKQDNVGCKILYLDAPDDVLVKRYKETRRTHPLAADGGKMRIEDAIAAERKSMEPLRRRADTVINTGHLLTRELRSQLTDILFNGEKFNNLSVTVVSFGFKYGIPTDADLVFDVRFMPNPYYYDNMRRLTGLDEPVRKFVLGFPEVQTFLDKLEDLLVFLIPSYIREGKTQLVIGIGCTGGQHRSVTIAAEISERLRKVEGCGVSVDHRDIYKDLEKNLARPGHPAGR